jgi:hypothetical protein
VGVFLDKVKIFFVVIVEFIFFINIIKEGGASYDYIVIVIFNY